jgi:hypothetical protein
MLSCNSLENKNNEFWLGDNFKMKNALREQVSWHTTEIRLKKAFSFDQAIEFGYC